MAMELPPGLRGYVAAEQQGQQQQLGQLQQAQVLMGLQGQMQQQQKARQYEAALQGLPAGASGEDHMRAVAPFVSPDKLADINSRNQDRADARKQQALQAAQALEFKQEQLNQRKAEADQKITDANQRAQFDQWYKTESLKLQQQNAQLAQQMKLMGIEIQRDRATNAQQQGVQKQTQQLGTALERAGLTEGDAVLRGVEDALKAKPDLAEYLSGPKSLLPDMVVDKDIAAGRQAFQKLFNITLKNRSGAAVTNQELDRLKNEFATGAFKTPDQLRAGVDQARKIISDHYRGVAAGFSPAALEQYNQNLRETGGTPLLEQGAAPPKTTSAPARVKSEAEYNALPSGAEYIAPDGSRRKKK